MSMWSFTHCQRNIHTAVSNISTGEPPSVPINDSCLLVGILLDHSIVFLSWSHIDSEKLLILPARHLLVDMAATGSRSETCQPKLGERSFSALCTGFTLRTLFHLAAMPTVQFHPMSAL